MKFYPAERLNLGIGAGAVAVSFAFASPLFASSLALGAALEAVNFRFLHRTGEELFGGVIQGRGPWVVVLGLRLTFLAVGIGAAMFAGADPLGLVVGLSLVMPATLVSALMNRPKDGELVLEPPVPAEDPSWDLFAGYFDEQDEQPNGAGEETK